MYGDTAVMRRHAAALREQGADLRALADYLVGQAEQVGWTGRAAEAMRERVRERAARLRGCAATHDGAADALQHHLHEVDRAKDAIADAERRAASLVAEDRTLVDFSPPPPGHRDWLTTELPGL